MVDREKVLTWLKICGENMDCSGCCPYIEVNKGKWKYTYECMMYLMRDAMEILKHDQETIESLQHTIIELTKSISE